MPKLKFKLGSDPELMLKDQKTNGLKSAIPVIPEGKGMGAKLKKGAVLHDNVLIEFNTDPAETEKDFVDTAKSVLQEISSRVGKAGYLLSVQASADFPDEELDNEEAMVFGCDPDFNAWTIDINPQPDPAVVGPLRSAGGHLHVGKADNEHVNSILDEDLGKIAIVRGLDIFCAIPFILIEQDVTAKRRREIYGRAGAHRAKEYGVEYRALSSAWLLSPRHAKAACKLVSRAIDIVCRKTDIEEIVERYGEGGPDYRELVEKLGGPEEICRIINDFDVEAAQKAYTNHIRPLLKKADSELVDSLINAPLANFYDSWKLTANAQ